MPYLTNHVIMIKLRQVWKIPRGCATHFLNFDGNGSIEEVVQSHIVQQHKSY
jgi:hypothetical protein